MFYIAKMHRLFIIIMLPLIFSECKHDNNKNQSSQNEQSVTEKEQKNNNKLNTLKINGVTLQVEIAQDEASLQKGLMFREDLPENVGMLFVFPFQRILSFWMRNTFIPLDIAFINENGIIVDIQKMAPLDETKNYISQAPALYALEVNEGWCKKNNVKVGDKVVF